MDPSLAALLKGIAVGLSIAAPVGPIGFLCIRRTLSGGWLVGLLTGLGAATADMVYGVVAAAGFTVVAEFLAGARPPLQLAGGGALIWLGLTVIQTVPAASERGAPTASGLAAAYGTTFLLTLANPATILSFAAVMAGLGAMGAIGRSAALVAGVFLGSALWWLLLSALVAAIRHRLSEIALRWINRGSGAALILFGALAMATAFS